MVKLLMLFMVILINTPTNNKDNLGYYVVMEKESKKVVEGHNYQSKRSVASISKLMTFLVASKYASLNDVYEVGDEINNARGSLVYLKKGERITLKELLIALILRSGNDAAMVIAFNVFNDYQKFILMMNKEASTLKMEDSSFNNPHGLDDSSEGNISSCYDIALLHAHLLNNNDYRFITNLKFYNSTNHGKWVNKNKLVHRYKYCSGGKTGVAPI